MATPTTGKREPVEVPCEPSVQHAEAGGGAPAGVDLLEDRTGRFGPAWFEEQYRRAGADASRVPWARGSACPHLVRWLNSEAPHLVRPGGRVAVVGCGLGDDVMELAARGYDAIGFDASPAAVGWAQKRFPAEAARFVQADLLNLPPRMLHRFDLVVDCGVLDHLPPEARGSAAASLAKLACSRGVVVTVEQGAPDDSLASAERVLPPWPICCRELGGLMSSAGLRPVREPALLRDERSAVVLGAYIHA